MVFVSWSGDSMDRFGGFVVGYPNNKLLYGELIQHGIWTSELILAMSSQSFGLAATGWNFFVIL